MDHQQFGAAARAHDPAIDRSANVLGLADEDLGLLAAAMARHVLARQIERLRADPAALAELVQSMRK